MFIRTNLDFTGKGEGLDKSYELYCLADPEFYDSAMGASVKDEPFAIPGGYT